MTVANRQDSMTGDEAGRVARQVKDYCDQAVANLKAGRIGEAYVYTNEALELDGKDPKAAAIRRYVLNALHPENRLFDKALALFVEAHQCIEAEDYDKAHELLTLMKKWHYALGINGIIMRSAVNIKLGRFDLAYLDTAEALAGGRLKDEHALQLVEGQKSCMRSLGFKVPSVVGPQQRRVDELPARLPLINQPVGPVEFLVVDLPDGSARLLDRRNTLLMPRIPLNQLAHFLNNAVWGAMPNGSITNIEFRGGDGCEEAVLRLIDAVTVPGRLHAGVSLIFEDFFHLPWASIERILDGRTLRSGNVINFHGVPSGVDPNELLKLPTVRECSMLNLQLERGRTSTARPSLLDNAALLGWLNLCGHNRRSRTLVLMSDCFTSGPAGFIGALKREFQQAAQVRLYQVSVFCPHDKFAGLGVSNEQLYNRLGERMTIRVDDKDEEAAMMRGHGIETVRVKRFLPQDRRHLPDARLHPFL